MACVGSVADALLDMKDEVSQLDVTDGFDLDHLFKNVVPQLLNDSGTSTCSSVSNLFSLTYPCDHLQRLHSFKVDLLCLLVNLF